MDVATFFVANAQAAELVEPRESSLHYPAPSAESTTVISVAHRE
jgi:hypothetical protein